MIQNRILIRCDAGTHIGMGHAMRCLALAEMLKNDFQIHFVLQSTSRAVHELIESYGYSFQELKRTENFNEDAINFCNCINASDIVILDGYNFKTEYQQLVRQKAKALVCIDDLHAWHHVADVVINHAEGVKESDYDCEPYTKLLLGLKYVLLRKAFLIKEISHKPITTVSKVFVSMGAADEHNLTLTFARALIQMTQIHEVHLMVSDINPHLGQLKDLAQNTSTKIQLHFNLKATELATLLRQCDVAICPASSISLECCAVGIGLVAGYTAENQKGNLQGVLAHNAAFNLGDFNMLNHDICVQELDNIFRNTKELNEQMANQSKMIDGKSGERFKSEFKFIGGEK
jgi:UDP-2,4-diacetamido-2,4,6-trideoxy-beta-L-altropyranose hydrolase